MAKSLQEQLMKAGLVDKKKANSLKKAHQHAKRTNSPEVDEASRLAKQVQKEKAERDKALSQQRNEQIAQKEVLAQIKQLIQSNQIDHAKGDIAYQFSDGKTIKKLYVNATLQSQLVNGIIAIARLKESYALVPKKVAEKISQRDASFIVVLNTGNEEHIAEDDPYADFQIPDDLMW
ncbi:MAG: DUF2058 domain-containing protein [Pseudomonadales bacterium]|nr:DUF2058 domain-containing protein [Pseudomonadales bacterium]